MPLSVLLAVLLALSVAGYYLGRSRALAGVGGGAVKLHSLPAYYGYYVALWCGIPALLVVMVWFAFEPAIVRMLLVSSLPPEVQALPEGPLGLVLNDVRNLATGNAVGADVNPGMRAAASYYAHLKFMGSMALSIAVLCFAVAGIAFGHRRIVPSMRARNSVEKAIMVILVLSSTIAVITTVGIVLSLLFESLRFFTRVPVTEFLFGLQWSPQMAMRADQVGSSGAFGVIPLFAGTLLISVIAMLVAGPVGLLSAIYLSEYAPRKVRDVVKPLLEVLAGVPTVVYGFFAALTVAPFIRDMGSAVGFDNVSSESALAAGVVMGIMIIPFVSSLSDDVINAVPQSLRDGSLALGATPSETIKRVVVPAALPGIVGGLLLGVSRAIGETMIVVMAAGMSANLTANPFEGVTTVTVQIVTLLVGDQEFDSPKTLAAFALGLLLFCITLILNVIALSVVNKYREQYE